MEIPPNEIPDNSTSEPELLDNLVCDVCFEANLTSTIHIQKCVQCNEDYCAHHASKIDPIHCNECMHDVTVTIETIKRTELHENHLTGQTTIRSRKARQITLAGSHWMFAQRSIQEMSDDELTLAIEYHKTFYDRLIYEREVRRTSHFNRNRGSKFVINTSTGTTTATTTVKKVRTVKAEKPDKAVVNLNAAIQNMINGGMTMEQIKTMLMGAAAVKK